MMIRDVTGVFPVVSLPDLSGQPCLGHCPLYVKVQKQAVSHSEEHSRAVEEEEQATAML